MLAIQKVNYILSYFEELQKATRSTKTVHSFSILIFSQYAPAKSFLVLATTLTHENMPLKNLSKMSVLSFSFDWNQVRPPPPFEILLIHQ